MTPGCVFIRKQHPASGFIDNEIAFLNLVHPNTAGLHHFQVYKLKNICSDYVLGSGLEFTWTVNVYSANTPENSLECSWIML